MCQTSVNLTPVKVTVMLVLIYIAGGVNVYLYGCVSLSAPVCAVCLCVCVCVIPNQSTSKKPHVSDLSKLDACQKSSGCGGLVEAGLDEI